MDASVEDRTVCHLIQKCGQLKEHERLLIICDASTHHIADLFHKHALSFSPSIETIEVPLADRHGQEPPDSVALKMRESNLIISLRAYSLAHSTARVEAAKSGARFLSMPDYSLEMLRDPALMVDYSEQLKNVKAISDTFTQGNTVVVRGVAGTEMHLQIQGRTANCCPGYVTNPGDLGSPPDIEANISPIEEESEGVAVIDGSITCAELGLLTTPVSLTVQSGYITNIRSNNSTYTSILEDMFGERGSKRRVLAECGIGLNPEAKLTGKMLTDEGAFGCIHFGFGANHTVGGLNKVDFHLDFVFTKGSLLVDGKEIMRDGRLTV